MRKTIYNIILIIYLSACTLHQKEKKEIRSWEFDNKICSGQFKNEMLDSTCVCYYKNGRKASEGNYNFGKKNGSHKEWFENELLKSETNYNNDVLTGICRYYYQNGNLRYESKMKQSVADGEFTYYYADGSTAIRGIGNNGKYVYDEIYNEKGIQMVKNGNGEFVLKEFESNYNITGTVKNGLVQKPFFHIKDQQIIDTIYSNTIF